MLGRVGQRLGHDVVRADLDLLGQPPSGTDLEVDGDRGTAGEHAQRRAQAALGQDGRVDAAGDVAQLIQRADRSGGGAVEVRGEVAEPGWHRRPRRAQLQRE